MPGPFFLCNFSFRAVLAGPVAISIVGRLSESGTVFFDGC